MTTREGSFTARSPIALLPGLAEISVRSPANRIGRRFPLDVRLEVDECHLTITPRPPLLKRLAENLQLTDAIAVTPVNLAIRVKYCHVRYACEGVSVIADSKYRSALEFGSFSEETAASSSDSRGKGGAVAASIGAGTGLSSNFALGAGAQVRAGAGSSSSANRETTIRVTRDLYEIEAIPSGWRVGDRKHGDPIKRGGCLDGQYFGRPVEDRANTCWVEFNSGIDAGRIRFEVVVRDGLRVERMDRVGMDEEERGLARSAMRDRIAAIRLERGLVSIAEDTRVGEITIAEVLCDCVADDNGAAHG